MAAVSAAQGSYLAGGKMVVGSGLAIALVVAPCLLAVSLGQKPRPVLLSKASSVVVHGAAVALVVSVT